MKYGCILIVLACVFGCSNAMAQCCTATRNLLVNGDFSEPVSARRPSGFRTGNKYSYDLRGPGLYSIIVSRSYGVCFDQPEYDRSKQDSTGQYLWYDTSEEDPAHPDTAWQAYFPGRGNADSSCVYVKPHTDYIFSFWARDLARDFCLVNEEAPLIAVKINDEQLKRVDLGLYISPCCPEWINICVKWNSGASSKAYLLIESIRKTGYTDLGIDDLFFGEAHPRIDIEGSADLLCNEFVHVVSNLEPGTFKWSTGETSNEIDIDRPGTYWTIPDINSCTDAGDTLVVRSPEGRELVIPNVFTPDGNLINDTFLPLIECPVENYHLRIYDRWGILLFHSRDKNIGWNGKMHHSDVADGTYYYLIEFDRRKHYRFSGVALKISR